jgi:hypothetical protein
VFKDRVLRRISGPRGRKWQKNGEEELHNLHGSLNIIRVIK